MLIELTSGMSCSSLPIGQGPSDSPTSAFTSMLRLMSIAEAPARLLLRQGVEAAEDLRFEVENPVLERVDVLEDLAVALEELEILLVLDIGLGGRVLEGQAIAQRLAIAGQEDQRRRVRGLRREAQVEQDERGRIEVEQEEDVTGDPDHHDHGLDDDESPAAQESRDHVGDPGAERRFVDQLSVDGRSRACTSR